jgi:hypothetical protein
MRLRPDHAVDIEAAVRLELAHSPLGGRSEDPIGIQAELNLELFDGRSDRAADEQRLRRFTASSGPAASTLSGLSEGNLRP